VTFAILIAALGAALVGNGLPDTSGAATPTASRPPVSATASPTPGLPFEIETVPAHGFPQGWWRITATDGSFRLVGPGPGELEANRRFWEMDVHGSLDPRCFMYLFDVGPVGERSAYVKQRLNAWADGFIAHDEPVPIRSGSAVGWRTHVTTRKGQPYGQLEVFYNDGWEFDIGYRQVNFTAETARLGDRFLGSFEAPVPRVGNGS
jgi:hypothetical protein